MSNDKRILIGSAGFAALFGAGLLMGQSQPVFEIRNDLRPDYSVILPRRSALRTPKASRSKYPKAHQGDREIARRAKRMRGKA